MPMGTLLLTEGLEHIYNSIVITNSTERHPAQLICYHPSPLIPLPLSRREAALNEIMTSQNGHPETVGIEWGLVCEHSALLSVVSSLFFVGAFAGAGTGGWLADRY
jgi:hypothetical protein